MTPLPDDWSKPERVRFLDHVVRMLYSENSDAAFDWGQDANGVPFSSERLVYGFYRGTRSRFFRGFA